MFLQSMDMKQESTLVNKWTIVFFNKKEQVYNALSDWTVFLFTWLKKYHFGMRNAYSYRESGEVFSKIMDWNFDFLEIIKVYIKLMGTNIPSTLIL